MPLFRIFCRPCSRSIKLKLNTIVVYHNVIFNRKYSSNKSIDSKDWIFGSQKNVTSKSMTESYNYFLADTLRYERNSYNELLEELDLQILGDELKYFFRRDIKQFKHFGIELDREKLVKNLIQHLEQFPFDMRPIYYKKNYRRDNISIRQILSIVQAQYLAHKLNTEFKIMCFFFGEMKSCIFHYKSMRSLRKNVDALLKDKHLRFMNVSHIVLFLNILRPFSVNELKNIEEDLLGMRWEKLPIACPSLAKHSYQGIMFRINALRHIGFTDEQIRLGLPYLGIKVPTILDNIEYMLSEFGSYKKDQFFLRLLGTCFNRKRGLHGMTWKSYDATQKALGLKEEKRLNTNDMRKVMCYLQDNVGITKKEWKIIRNHPASVVYGRLSNTMTLLEEKGFTKTEILESIAIVLYPRYIVEKCLAKVWEEAEYLKKFGFENGCLKRSTKYFANGTKHKRKTLQLCLYYIEKSIYVSDSIVLDFEKVDEGRENLTSKTQAEE